MQTTTTLLSLALLAVVLPAGAAQASDERACRHSAPQSLTLDIGDARSIEIHVGASTLRIDGRAGKAGQLGGRACASSAGELARLRLEQSREGDRLVVRLLREERNGWALGSHYARFELAGSVPDAMPVDIRVGSGDVRAHDLSALTLSAGSGDVDARRIRGAVDARVGSGDITLVDIGSLAGGAIGSGDLKVRGVRGDARVDSIGSGDLELRDVRGNVAIGAVGSGDAGLRDITGSVDIASLGSGDIEVSGVGGGLRLRSSGSGSIDHRGIAGTVDLPRKR
jgi:hypothetical protein